MNEIQHGKTSTYVNNGCRCDLCKAAWREYNNEARKRRIAAPKDPNDPRHGTASFYTSHGCRCDRCKDAMRNYKAGLKARFADQVVTAADVAAGITTVEQKVQTKKGF